MEGEIKAHIHELTAAIRRVRRLAIRTLRATPAGTLVGILSLALGGGANTAMCSIVSSLLLRALRVERPDRSCCSCQIHQ
jgi:hypothetical protein